MFSWRMMFTCSALRCSVFDGSAISGSPRDARADDPPATQGIPDSVLYVTVDDPAFPGMRGDVEHLAHLALDAPRDVRAGRGREPDPGEVLRADLVEETRIPDALRGGRAKGAGVRPPGRPPRCTRVPPLRRAGVGAPSLRRCFRARMWPNEPAPCTTRSGCFTAASSRARRRIAVWRGGRRRALAGG